jgi:hypothetical protein
MSELQETPLLRNYQQLLQLRAVAASLPLLIP